MYIFLVIYDTHTSSKNELTYRVADAPGWILVLGQNMVGFHKIVFFKGFATKIIQNRARLPNICIDPLYTGFPYCIESLCII